MIFLDGMVRFVRLTSGVWTDDSGIYLKLYRLYKKFLSVRSYNVVGRADRYMNDAPGASAQRALSRLGVLDSDPTLPQESLHENVMSLLALSRSVVWIPIPLCVIITKVTNIPLTFLTFLVVQRSS